MVWSINIFFALLLSVFAGLSTSIGSLIAYFIKKPKMIYLSFGLGLSGGVMTYVSFVELLPMGIEGLGQVWGIILFFIGIAFIMLIDFIIPEGKNPHHPFNPGENKGNLAETAVKMESRKESEHNVTLEDPLMKTGVSTALAIAIHNFPEGLASFGSALSSIKLGVVIAIAIAIHNIPEGISVSLPIYYATGDKKRAFWWSSLSGIAEPIGAFIGFMILRSFLNDAVVGGLLSFVGGIMVYISLDEILPTAHHYGHGHEVIIGVVLGMILMALSLILL